MSEKTMLSVWILEALEDLGGEAVVLDVSKHIWKNHEEELRKSDTLFYRWQYDMRWAAQELQNQGRLRKNRSNRTWIVLP